MTNATTLNGLDRTLISGAAGGSPSFPKFSFPKFRATWPELPTTGSLLANAAGVALRVSLAAVPFAGLGWLFFTR